MRTTALALAALLSAALLARASPVGPGTKPHVL